MTSDKSKKYKISVNIANRTHKVQFYHYTIRQMQWQPKVGKMQIVIGLLYVPVYSIITR